MCIDRLDHLILTVADIDATVTFYSGMLGMKHPSLEGRHSVHFGAQKINLHEAPQIFEPNAGHATPGSGDLRLVTTDALTAVLKHRKANGVAVEERAVGRIGALGPMRSACVRDRERNLIEIAAYGSTAPARKPRTNT